MCVDEINFVSRMPLTLIATFTSSRFLGKVGTDQDGGYRSSGNYDVSACCHAHCLSRGDVPFLQKT